MSWLANGCYLIAGLFYLPVLLYQMSVQGKNRRGWRQRFGRVPPCPGPGLRVWIHAVSLGEINATRQLVAGLRQARPDLEIVISTTTDTGFARARELYPDVLVFRFPLDFSWVVRRVLARIRPSLILLMELEVWYNLVTLAARRGVPVCVANGRFTERSSRRLAWLGPLIRPMFAALTWVGAQTPDIAGRFRRHGTPAGQVEIAGSVKWDTATVSDGVEGAEALARDMGIDRRRPLIVLGSSGPGEEQQVLDAWRRLHGRTDCTLAVVPRKPERFEEVNRLLTRDGSAVRRRSGTLHPGPGAPGDGAAGRLLLGDTMGELRKFYSLADVAIVGRSLVPMGGSDPMEAAALGKPVVVGPHTDNFADPVERLRDGGALIVVRDPEELAEQVQALLGDAQRRRDMGRRGQAVVRQNQGATRRTVDKVLELLAS